jgi:hypothetical protein
MAPIDGALVLFVLGEEILVDTTTAADGTFSADLLSSEMIGAQYDVIVQADNYIAHRTTTEGWDFEAGEVIELTPIAGDAADFSVTGQVSDRESGEGVEGSKVACEVAGEPLEVYTDEDGFYTLWLPQARDTLDPLQAKASKVGYAALRQNVLSDPDFVLVPQETDPQVAQEVCADGGRFLEGSCIVSIPADALDGCYDLNIDLISDMGVKSTTTAYSDAVMVVDLGGADLTKPLMICIPFNPADVNPGDFVDGNVRIYHAPTVNDLLDGTNLTHVAPEDIEYEDPLNEEVCFWVGSLSAFGVGPILPPVVTAVDPTSGPVSGGQTVTITGANFFEDKGVQPTVTFGGSAATNVTVVSASRITCTTPAHAAGSVNVTVTNPDGQSFTFLGAALTGSYTFISAGAGADPELYGGSGGGGGGGGGGCFIATAALGPVFEAGYSTRIEALDTSAPVRLTIQSSLILLVLVTVLLISRRQRNNLAG